MTNQTQNNAPHATKSHVPAPVNGWLLKALIGGGLILLVAALVGFFWINQPASPASGEPLRAGVKMTEFSLQDIQGKIVRLSDYAGKTVLVNTWATWCPPCRAEMPALNAFYQQHQADGFVILAINAGETQTEAADFARQYSLKFPVLLDSDQRLMDRLNIHDFPTSVLIGKDGLVKTIHVGMLTPDMIQSEILPLIQ